MGVLSPALFLLSAASAPGLAVPVVLHIEGIPADTRIAFTLGCHLEARDYIGGALSGSAVQAPSILGKDGPWKDAFRVQADLDSQQGRPPFVFRVPTEPRNSSLHGTRPAAVFNLSFEYRFAGMPVVRGDLVFTRVDPQKPTPTPLALHCAWPLAGWEPQCSHWHLPTRNFSGEIIIAPNEEAPLAGRFFVRSGKPTPRLPWPWARAGCSPPAR